MLLSRLRLARYRDKDSLLDACNFVAAVEKRQGLKIACLEEIAYQLGYVSADKLLIGIEGSNSDYGQYVRFLIEGR